MRYSFTIESEDLIVFEGLIARLTGKPSPSAQSANDGAIPVETIQAEKKKRKAKSDQLNIKDDSEPELPLTQTPAVPYEEVKKITLELIRSKGRETALGVLSSMNVKSAQELPEERRAEYLNLCKEALAA